MGDTGTPTRKFLNRQEAADYISDNYFKVTKRTLALWASFQEGPPYRLIAGQAHYTKSDIDAWIDRPSHDGAVRPTRITGGALAGVTRK
jgi:hypothetical protein